MSAHGGAVEGEQGVWFPRVRKGAMPPGSPRQREGWLVAAGSALRQLVGATERTLRAEDAAEFST